MTAYAAEEPGEYPSGPVNMELYAFDANNYLQVLDYKTASTILQFPILSGTNIGQMISATDGKYLIASRGTTVYRFDTELLSPKNGSKTTMVKTKSAFMK